MPRSICPICQHATVRGGVQDSNRIDCFICGVYLIADAVRHNWFHARQRNGGRLDDGQQQLLSYLSAATRQAKTPITIKVENWEEIAQTQRLVPIDHKLRLLLQHLAKESAAPGDWVGLHAFSGAALAGARDETEFQFLMQHLAAADYLEGGAFDTLPADVDLPTNQGVIPGYRLTVKGWEAVQPLSGSVMGTCFVAMAFHKSLDLAYEHGIVPAVETDCGFTVLRIDRVEHNEPITDKIIAGIRGAQFVVADFTLQRQGVYYEAGFALGLGRDVVWTCREEDEKNLHFDTRQYNHVMWTTPNDLRTKLTNRIRATIPGAKQRI